MKTIYVLLLSLVGLASCIDQISIDLPEPPKKLVMNAILTPDSIFRVQVSRVTSTTDSTSRLLSSAKVYLLSAARGMEQLRNQGIGLYYSSTRPVVGSGYTLRAEVDGYPAVSATDTIPSATAIREAWYSYPTGTNQNNELLGSVVVRFDDPVQTTNFYEITLTQGQDLILDARGNAALAAEDDTGFNPESLVFSDQLFNGRPFELRASFLPNNYGTTNGKPTISSDLHLTLRSVSQAYYQYRKSWTRHLYNQGSKGLGSDLNQLLFLGDPIRMYSNVNEGYGVIASYAQQTMSLPLR